MTSITSLIVLISIYFISALGMFLSRKSIIKNVSIEELKQQIKAFKKITIIMFFLSCLFVSLSLYGITTYNFISIANSILVGFLLVWFHLLNLLVHKSCLKEKEKEQEYELKNHTQN